MFNRGNNTTLRLVSRRTKVKERRIFAAALNEDFKPDPKVINKLLESYFLEDNPEEKKPLQYGMLFSLLLFLVLLFIVFPMSVDLLDIEKRQEEIYIPAGGTPVPVSKKVKKVEVEIQKRELPQLYPEIEDLHMLDREEKVEDITTDWLDLDISGDVPSSEFGLGGSGGGPIMRAGAGGQVPAPELIFRVEPDYPSAATKARRNGFVLIKAIIDKQGNVVNINVMQEPPRRFGFGEKAKEAVAQWKFTPSIYKGNPVTVEIQFTVDFNILY
jgi:TonB family protein